MINKLEVAIKKMELENATCVLISGDKEYVSHERGIASLVNWLDSADIVSAGCVIADKIIGKAAALLMIYGKVKAVYGTVMSESANSLFSQSDIEFSYGELVPNIINRAGTDICPMEKIAKSLNSPQEAFIAYRKIV